MNKADKAKFVQRDLPAAPSWATPVGKIKHLPTDNPEGAAAVERAGRIENARRLNRFLAWYNQRRAEYGGPR